MATGSHAFKCKMMAAVAALVIPLGTLGAAVIASEDFSYTAGTLGSTGGTVPLSGLNGGTGWSSAWSGATTAAIVAGNLTYGTLNPTTAGNNCMEMNDGGDENVTRTFSTTLGTTGTTGWFSYIAQKPGWFPSDSVSFGAATAAFQLIGSHQEGSSLTTYPDNWSVKVGSTTVATSVSARTSPTLALWKVDFLAGEDNVSVWLNPDLSNGEAGLGTATATWSGTPSLDFTVNKITIQGWTQQSIMVDRIAVGTTYGDVVPEPVGLSLLSLASGVTLLRRRTRHA